MKKLLFILIVLFSSIFYSCKNEPVKWVIISVVENEDAVFHSSYQADGSIKTWIDTSPNKELVFNLSLLPNSNDYIDIIKVYSTNPDVAYINYIDLDKRTISVITFNTGEAKIIVKTESFSSCTSPIITVR